MNFDLFNKSGTILKGKLYVSGYVDSGVTGEVRLYNVTDGQTLGTISFSEVYPPTLKSVALSNLPSSGTKQISFEMKRTAGTGQSEQWVDVAAVDFYLEAVG